MAPEAWIPTQVLVACSPPYLWDQVKGESWTYFQTIRRDPLTRNWTRQPEVYCLFYPKHSTIITLHLLWHINADKLCRPLIMMFQSYKLYIWLLVSFKANSQLSTSGHSSSQNPYLFYLFFQKGQRTCNQAIKHDVSLEVLNQCVCICILCMLLILKVHCDYYSVW